MFLYCSLSQYLTSESGLTMHTVWFLHIISVVLWKKSVFSRMLVFKHNQIKYTKVFMRGCETFYV